jgi:hypothetical protein
MAEWQTPPHEPGARDSYKIAVLGPRPEVTSKGHSGKLIVNASFANGIMEDKGSKSAGIYLALIIRKMVPEAVVYSAEISDRPFITDPDNISQVSHWRKHVCVLS